MRIGEDFSNLLCLINRLVVNRLSGSSGIEYVVDEYDHWYLPVLASADATLSIAQVQKLKYFLLCHLILILMVVLVLVVRLLAVALPLHLVAAVLFEDLEATAETLALLAHEDPLIFECLRVRPFRFCRPSFLADTKRVFLVVHRHRRLSCQPQ